VRARSEREWIIAALPGKLGFLDEPGFSSTRVSKLTLIDWCRVGAPDAAADEALFRSMYAGWLRWEEPYPGLAGRFRYSKIGADVDIHYEGTFELDATARARVTVDTGHPPGDTSRPEKTVGIAF